MPAYVTMKSVKPYNGPTPLAVFTIGGFEIEFPVLKNGKEEKHKINFDFYEYDAGGDVEEDGHLYFTVRLKNLDDETFPECRELTNQILKNSKFTEIYYECYSNKSESEESFVRLEPTYFEFDMDFGNGNTLKHSFTAEQLKDIIEEERNGVGIK